MYVISWRWNDKVYREKYETYVAALIRFDQLSRAGKEPSLHTVD